jgi:TP53 regulating kinase and related kinases
MAQIITNELIKQGAEGKLYIDLFNGQKCLVKERFVKNYRHPDLDKSLTKSRMKAEQKAIQRCSTAGVVTPKLLNVDFNTRKMYMEYLEEAITAKLFIDQRIGDGKKESEIALKSLGDTIGLVIRKMHDHNIIHGDLTTSNMMIRLKQDESLITINNLIMIDFGLSSYSASPEDKGVDLYVLERALLSTHSKQPDFFPVILEAYKGNNTKGCQEIINKFEEVRARGRKRTMIG